MKNYGHIEKEDSPSEKFGGKRMKILKKERKMCISCMEEHEVFLIEVSETNVFKGQQVEYKAIYECCEHTEEYFATTDLITQNDIAMKNAYRKSKGLLLTDGHCVGSSSDCT